MIIQVDSKELDEFFAKVGKATVRKTLQGSLRKSLFLLENEAKKETPVDTGFLRNSYETNQTDLEWILRNVREYAPYVHDGHRQRPGRFVQSLWKRLVADFVKGNPFLDRAKESAAEQITDIFNQDIADLLNSLTE